MTLAGRVRAIVAAVADIVAVVVFVAIGRNSHDEGSALGGTLKIAAPFLLGLALGWAVARAWRRPLSVPVGAIIWIVTVAAGMVLRRTVFDRGAAVSFVIVATIVLGVFVVGWRFVLDRLAARRHAGAI